MNGLLLLQFPLVHSLLLTGAGQRFLKRLAPASLGASLSSTTYVTVASLQILGLFLGWSPSGVIWWQAAGCLRLLWSAFYVLSWLLLLKAMVDSSLALQSGSLGWWAVFKNRPPCYPKMPVSGMFRWCRQPIYLCFALTTWTVPTWTPDQLLVSSVLSLYCLIGPLFKEARYERRYGDDFLNYRKGLPYFLPRPPA